MQILITKTKFYFYTGLFMNTARLDIDGYEIVPDALCAEICDEMLEYLRKTLPQTKARIAEGAFDEMCTKHSSKEPT